MAHYLDGRCFRYTFIFKKENVTEDIGRELQAYISTYHKQVEEEDMAGVTSACNLHAYEDVLIIEEEDTRIAPVLIIVFYGQDWMNFIQDLLTFQETFPSYKLPREADYNFVLRDESKVFDDFK